MTALSLPISRTCFQSRTWRHLRSIQMQTPSWGISLSPRFLSRWRVPQVAYSVSYTDKDKMSYMINSSNRQVRSRTISLGALTQLCAPTLFSFSNPRFQLLRYNGSSSRAYYDDAGRRTSTSPNADNTIDDPARSLVGVGLTGFATLAPTVHRHGLDLSSPPRPPAKAGSSMACAQVARSHDTGSWARRT